jgi:hypothetical protein
VRQNRKESPLDEKNREENDETFPEGEPVHVEDVKKQNGGYGTGNKTVRETLFHESADSRVSEESGKDDSKKLSKRNIEHIENGKKNEYTEKYQNHSKESQVHPSLICTREYSTTLKPVLE